ncbi:MAG: hypothetical protein CMA72_07320 [Euryarchaeota archaeon]|nr:hypothetical protein [Euryarchaeota archaeon]|tara:strand:- start:940 stop:1218 length:279 start_codon:yes stop_codon:yes gene_type:complete
MKEVYETMVSTMSDDDIMTLWHAIAEEHKRRKNIRGAENKKLLRKGDHVAFSTKSGQVTGTITKVKQVNALVKSDGTSLVWNVRISSLTKIA